MSDRKPWENYFMDIAELVASRSTCDRALVGCLIVNNDNRIIATGYNGSPYGNSHCDDIGHTMRDNHCIATIHAEMNALLYCAREGIAVKDCKIFVTHFPCLNCTKALIQAGIKKVYYKNDYRIDDYAVELFKKNNVVLQKII